MLFLLLLFSYSLATSRPLLFGGGTSLTFKFEMPLLTSTSLDATSAFLSFLVGVDVPLAGATVFFPAEEILELACYFSLAKFEPFACAARTTSSGLGSENAAARKEDEDV